MKKYRRILTVLLAFFAFASMAKAQKTYYFYDEGRVIYQIPFADVDSITLDPIVELAVDNITLFNVNDSCRLDLKVEPEGVIEYSDIKWTSADENVALIRNDISFQSLKEKQLSTALMKEDWSLVLSK